MTNDASVQTVLHALPAALPLPTEPDTDPSVHSVPHVRRTSRSPPRDICGLSCKIASSAAYSCVAALRAAATGSLHAAQAARQRPCLVG